MSQSARYHCYLAHVEYKRCQSLELTHPSRVVYYMVSGVKSFVLVLNFVSLHPCHPCYGGF